MTQRESNYTVPDKEGLAGNRVVAADTSEAGGLSIDSQGK